MYIPETFHWNIREKSLEFQQNFSEIPDKYSSEILEKYSCGIPQKFQRSSSDIFQ